MGPFQSACTGGAPEYTPRASDNPIHSVPGSSQEPPCPAHPRASSLLSTPMNNLNPSAGHAATEWELVNNAWDSLDPDPDSSDGLDDDLLDDDFDETENSLQAPEDNLAASNPNSQPKSEILNPQSEIPPRPLDPFDYQPKSNFIY
jgi:hypothetical protein